MGNSASIPSYPDPPPLSTFRGVPLTHEAAEGIFIGHLQPRPADTVIGTGTTIPVTAASAGSDVVSASSNSSSVATTGLSQSILHDPNDPSSTSLPYLNWSWKVVCGQNPAYDYFGCQHQIFYRDAEKPKVVWYDPVFKVRWYTVCVLSTLLIDMHLYLIITIAYLPIHSHDIILCILLLTLTVYAC